MRVGEAMTLEVRTVDAAVTVRQAAQLMKDDDLGLLPVESGGRLVGMLTERDIVSKVVAERKNPRETLVGEIMSRHFEFCFEDEYLQEVGVRMAELQRRRLPVLNRNRRLVGIISSADIARHDVGHSVAPEVLRRIG